MPLTFLAPLFLIAAAAVAIPIIVHLREKQKKNVVDFPSLMFLEQIPFRSTQKRKIRHWALLALRALAIILLALAFARPFFTDETAAATAALGPRERVIVVDRSYSMAFGDRWEQVKELAREQTRGLGPTDRLSLVFFDRGAEAAVRSASDPARVRSVIDTARPSSQITRYGPGLKLAQTILEESEYPNLEAVLISDFQRVGWTGDEGVSFPAGTEVTPVSVESEDTGNVALTGLQLRRDFFSARERMTPTARVVRSGGEGPLQTRVTLELDGQEIQTEAVTLEGTGATTVTFEPFTLATEFTRGRIHLDADRLAADNEIHFVLSPGRALSALLLNGPNARDDQSLFFERALEITEDASFSTATRGSVNLTEADVGARDLVVLNDADFPSGVSRERLRRFVQDGGGLLVALGDRAEWSPDLADWMPGRFGPAADIRGGTARLGFLDYDHPVFEIFAGPRSGDFSRARFFRIRPLTVFEEGRVLARFDDGSIALAERRVGEGRVLVWTSTLDAFWNDLALQPVFLPFVHEMARYLGKHRERVPWFTAGQVLNLSDPEVLRSAGLPRGETIPADEERVAITPSGGSIPLPAGEGPRYLELSESGFYAIRPPGTDPTRPFTVAVNVDVAESDLTPMDPAEVAAAVEPRNGGTRSAVFEGVDPELRARSQERRQGLWRFLLVSALLLLLAETVVSNVMSGTATTRSM